MHIVQVLLLYNMILIHLSFLPPFFSNSFCFLASSFSCTMRMASSLVRTLTPVNLGYSLGSSIAWCKYSEMYSVSPDHPNFGPTISLFRRGLFIAPYTLCYNLMLLYLTPSLVTPSLEVCPFVLIGLYQSINLNRLIKFSKGVNCFFLDWIYLR